MHNEPTQGEAQPVFWADMMARWRTLPARTRWRVARRAGAHLHALWRNKVDIARLPLELTRFHWSGLEPRWVVTEDSIRRTRFVQSHDRICRTLIRWHRTTGHALTRKEAALFLGGFLKQEKLEKPTVRQLARELDADGVQHLALRPGKEYARALRMESDSAGGPYRGYWASDPGLPAALLAAETNRAERTMPHRPLKQGPRITVFRAPLYGKDTLVKRYDINSWPDRLRYLLRTSRGRRAWAVGETFRMLQIPTPRPLGYLEVRKRGLPLRSYVFTEFERESDTARRWICRHWRRSDDTVKRAFRAALQDMLNTLYRANIYHADTKLANLMARPADGSAVPDLMWIDLECVRFGVRATEHRMIRNLVQMNGSVRNAWMTETERLVFLREMAETYPFLMDPRNIDKMRRWTVARWHKELRTRCGP